MVAKRRTAFFLFSRTPHKHTLKESPAEEKKEGGGETGVCVCVCGGVRHAHSATEKHSKHDSNRR